MSGVQWFPSLLDADGSRRAPGWVAGNLAIIPFGDTRFPDITFAALAVRDGLHFLAVFSSPGIAADAGGIALNISDFSQFGGAIPEMRPDEKQILQRVTHAWVAAGYRLILQPGEGPLGRAVFSRQVDVVAGHA